MRVLTRGQRGFEQWIPCSINLQQRAGQIFKFGGRDQMQADFEGGEGFERDIHFGRRQFGAGHEQAAFGYAERQHAPFADDVFWQRTGDVPDTSPGSTRPTGRPCWKLSASQSACSVRCPPRTRCSPSGTPGGCDSSAAFSMGSR